MSNQNHQRVVCATLAQDIEEKTIWSQEAFWRQRDRRCLRDNRQFACVRGGSCKGYAVTQLDPVSLQSLLADPDAPFMDPKHRVLKHSRSSTVIEMRLMVGDRLVPVIYKRFAVTKATAPWTALVRWSPTMRSWLNGQRLVERGLATARPLAAFHRYRYGLPCEGYLITEKLADVQHLHDFMDALATRPQPDRRQLLRQSVEQLARLLRELHARFLCHRDLKATNILYQAETAAAQTGQSFWLIDLVGVSRCGRRSRNQCVKNLARLHSSFWNDPRLTRTDKLRFLRTYLHWYLHGQHSWKQWWHAIDVATQQKVSRNQKSGRLLS